MVDRLFCDATLGASYEAFCRDRGEFGFYLALVIVIVLLIMLANKIKVAYPVLLVLAGLAISVIPGIPQIDIKPDLIFFIFPVKT